MRWNRNRTYRQASPVVGGTNASATSANRSLEIPEDRSNSRNRSCLSKVSSQAKGILEIGVSAVEVGEMLIWALELICCKDDGELVRGTEALRMA